MRMVHGAEPQTSPLAGEVARQGRWGGKTLPLLVRVRRSVTKRRPSPAGAGAARGESAAGGVGIHEGQWGDVVDLMPQVMMVVDGAGRVLQANAAALRILGHRFDSVTECRLLQFVAPSDRQKAAAAWQRPFARRLGWQVRLETTAARALFSFDCIPFAFRDGGTGLAMIGRQLTGLV
jgi:PAS domain-containing protein